MRYQYRILNVFAASTFGGNPLCVFEDARGLDTATMQALARQFNLSETTFLFPSTDQQADAEFRIFTVGYEMPFAGHPSLGTAHVLRSLRGGDAQSLRCKAGLVRLTAEDDVWALTAPNQGRVLVREEDTPLPQVATMMGLQEHEIIAPALWLDTGTDQLLIQASSADAVRKARPSQTDFWPRSSIERRTAYLFALEADQTVVSRYFFVRQDGGVSEDPGTGSACANLGGWMLHHGYPLPQRWQISQGEAVQRPCELHLEITPAREIKVGGQVLELGRGYIDLP